MENNQIIKDIFTDIWNLLKIYGINQQLDDEQWELFIREGEEKEKKYIDAPYNGLYRGLFGVLQKYYEGKYRVK